MRYSIGKFDIWAIRAAKHFEVLVTERKEVFANDAKHIYNVYVNLFKTGYLKLDQRNYPSDQTDMVEYQTYLSRKDSPQPLSRVSEDSLKLIVQWLDFNKD